MLHAFASPPKGATPYSGVIRDSAGNLYGTTENGGIVGLGVVYTLDATGHQKVLYSFTGGADGGGPRAGVIRDSDGNLYGTTYGGGTANLGVVYKLDTAGQETVLHSFTSGTDGANPLAGVISDSAGNLYGTTYGGGTGGAGVVYKLDTAGQETVLYSFAGGADGSSPWAGVTRDSAGNLYGTTSGGGIGGVYGGGVVFKVDTAGRETVLYSFTGGADGSGPFAGVIRDAAGNLYGTTSYGGAANAGVVYQLDTSGQETVLYGFTGKADGKKPEAGLIRDSAGNLYGTTQEGGIGNAGVVYKLDTAGQETVLYTFNLGAHDGGQPYAGVIRDPAGNLYGTTPGGGTVGWGVVYKLDAAGQQTVLYSFPGPVDGSHPDAGVIRDSAGNLYGTTFWGGAAGGGAVYKLDTAGRETVLYSFTGGAAGDLPYAGVIRDSAGKFYGTTTSGGTAQAGVVYDLDATGQETVLYSFMGGVDGNYPEAGVIRDSAGNLYGTTYYGGTANAGVVYKLDTAGQETVLYSFTGGADGGHPRAGVIRDSVGNLYGTTQDGGTASAGVVYKLDKVGQETVLYSFTGRADGGHPRAGVIQDLAGNLYGTTVTGGARRFGVVYKLDTAGQETVLYSFTGGTDGGWPYAGVIRDPAGNLYGTTFTGGTAQTGVVYKLDTAGRETVLYSFTGNTDGGVPMAGVICDPAGNLYGTAFNGGTGSGVIFEIKNAVTAQ